MKEIPTAGYWLPAKFGFCFHVVIVLTFGILKKAMYYPIAFNFVTINGWCQAKGVNEL